MVQDEISGCDAPTVAHENMQPEPSRTTHRIKVIVGLVVVLGAMSYLGFTAFQSATVYFYTVSEIQGIGPTDDGRIVRVSGKLVPETFVRENASTVARFTLRDTDGTETLAAMHEGVVPDLFFNDHSEIILEGTYRDDGVFHSQNVIVKCPSKYVAAG